MVRDSSTVSGIQREDRERQTSMMDMLRLAKPDRRASTRRLDERVCERTEGIEVCLYSPRGSTARPAGIRSSSAHRLCILSNKGSNYKLSPRGKVA